MIYESLNGMWEMKTEDSEFMPAAVPGSVYSAMLANGRMEDPYYRDNELKALELMNQDFVFRRKFDLSGELAQCGKLLLHCDGLDTLCRIFVNETEVGFADNFHRTWEFDVTAAVRAEDNELRIEIASPVKYIKEEDEKWYVGGSIHAMRGFPHLRKPHCMFGWDWGPRLPDAGIWRDISLVGVNSSKIEDIHIVQNHDGEQVFVKTAVKQSQNAEIIIRVTSPGGEVISAPEGEFAAIPNPQLWWPNGFGEQPLYEVAVELLEDGRIVDSQSRKIGLRTTSVVRKKDEWGESFSHCVNGLEFFAMGADYIPEDNIFSRMTPERTRNLLMQCKAANFNVIRVWGGGCYPSDAFFDACDELGLVVWVDFMFACANYPLDDKFEQSITAEITDNVRRIRHHASLGLWCGNNEMEMFEVEGKYDSDDITRAHYIRMYEHIIPHILKKEDPVTFYWPASPSSGGSFVKPNDPDCGDVHYWEVWHGGEPFSAYRNFFFRYVSEFGFQSFPELKTIESFTLPEDRNVFSRVMEMHQRNEGANGKILQYLSKTFLYPHSFETLLYASQLLQAEAIKYGVEHWRRNRGRCMGAVYWQLNDIWPVASWASIDYYNRWKALHYYAKRFFAPVMISCEEVCETTTRTSVVEEPSTNISTVRLAVANETTKAVKGRVFWKLCDAGSTILESGDEEIEVEALTSKWLPVHDYSETGFLENHFTYSFAVDGDVVSEGSVLFTAPKHYGFRNPNLSCKMEGDRITVRAEAYAKSVEILSPDCDMILEDNYFDMEEGERSVRILQGNPKELVLRSVYDIR